VTSEDNDDRRRARDGGAISRGKPDSRTEPSTGGAERACRIRLPAQFTEILLANEEMSPEARVGPGRLLLIVIITANR